MTDTTDIDAGIAAADGPEKTAEYSDVKAWAKKIEDGRKFDEPARKQYVRDRRYARGDSGFDVDANIIGTYIDIKEAFLYAKDPDLDVTPAKACQPPSIDALRDAAEESVKGSPEVQQAGAQAAALAVAMGVPPEQALPVGMAAADAKTAELIEAQYQALQKRYAKRLSDTKAFAQTGEIVVSRLWKDARLKRYGRKLVRSGQTIGVGVLKASWQERTAPSPETVKAINDLQDNIKRAAAQRAALEEANPGIFERIKQGFLSAVGQDADAKLADYQRQLTALQGEAERVVARGFVTDHVRSEDFQVAPGFDLADHCDAPWNAHRIPMPYAEAMAHFGLSDEVMKQATRYTSRKPEMVQAKSAMVDMEVEATEADAYTTTGDSRGATEGVEWIMVWEVWDRDANSVLTLIEGVKCWAKPAWTPPPTTRFYPFFLYATSEVDGQRHPQSLTSRSAKLVDEFYRILSAEREHRRRIKPKTVFNRGGMSKDDVDKIERGVTQEMVGIAPTNPKGDLRGMLVPLAYAALDPALYSTDGIEAKIERIWGIQEALSGSVTVQKTLGEAEIQQAGFQARTNAGRDALDSVLQELAQYTFEVARKFLSAEDVQGIAGPDALWPAYEGPDDLTKMLNIDIRAGSSGKPDTTAERQAWSMAMPVYAAGIDKIGMLRNSSPEDVADCHAKLLRITAERSGDRLDIDSLIPKPGLAPVMPGMPGAAPGAPGAAPQPGAAPAIDPAAPVPQPEPATA